MTRRLKNKLARRSLLCLGLSNAALVIVLVTVRSSVQPEKRRTGAGTNTVPTQNLRVPELNITNVVQHGHIVEIQAKVEPGATVMINGERAAVIWEDGEIKHFVGPLPDGVNDIAITVQNEEGGINSKRLSVVLP